MELVTYWDLCKEVSHRLEICAKMKEVSTRSSPIGDWSKGSRLVFWDRLGSGKIPYTCNYLLLINGFLGVVT